MPNLYIIAGCNGAGKTTASFTILPEILNCREFVNADIIAAEISPLNPESAALEAGRLMLQKIHLLIKEQVDFAFETTLATRSYVSLIKNVKAKGYEVILLYYWLSSPAFAKTRVASRVAEGGHHIASDVIERRYYRGIHNLTNLYIPICDNWLVIDNMTVVPETIALGAANYQQITNISSWKQLQHPTALMHDKEIQLPELSDKVMPGMRKAMRKLVETNAAQNKNLIVADKEGNPISVPAKDLLKTLK